MAGFRINHSQVVRQANKISDLSDDLSNQIVNLEVILASVNSNWNGPASKQYQNHLKLLIADMKKTKHSMSRVASTIKNVADRIQREDERQAERARRLAERKAKNWN